MYSKPVFVRYMDVSWHSIFITQIIHQKRQRKHLNNRLLEPRRLRVTLTLLTLKDESYHDK
jgi:hypothetical protein